MSSLDKQLKRLDRMFAAQARKKEAESANANTEADKARLLELNTVTKSNALMRAYYRFSLAEKRCMESLISKLHPQRIDNPPIIELSAMEYSKLYNIDMSNAYKQMTGAVDGLMNKVILVKSPTCELNYTKYNLTSMAEYRVSEGTIQVRFAPDIYPHLVGLRRKFTSYPLKQAAPFTSSYTWRFYELLASWAKPKEETQGLFAGWLKIEVEELRSLLGVPPSYGFEKVQSRVLDIAMNELLTKAGIVVSLERIKRSRKITHLSIKFIELEKEQKGGTEEEQHELSV